MAFILTLINLGIGTIKPNFWEKNPEKLSTSPGGLAATALCLFYIGISTQFLFGQRGEFFSPEAIFKTFLASLILFFLIFRGVNKRINSYEI